VRGRQFSGLLPDQVSVLFLSLFCPPSWAGWFSLCGICSAHFSVCVSSRSSGLWPARGRRVHASLCEGHAVPLACSRGCLAGWGLLQRLRHSVEECKAHNLLHSSGLLAPAGRAVAQGCVRRCARQRGDHGSSRGTLSQSTQLLLSGQIASVRFNSAAPCGNLRLVLACQDARRSRLPVPAQQAGRGRRRAVLDSLIRFTSSSRRMEKGALETVQRTCPSRVGSLSPISL